MPDNNKSEKTSKNSKWNKIQDWKYGNEIETEIPNIFQEEQKFLGKLLFPTGKLIDSFDYIKIKFEIKFVNINALLIRDEYKVWIYKHYFNPYNRKYF